MTDSTVYYIWLTLALGYRSAKPKTLKAIYPDFADFYNGGEAEWRLSGVMTEKNISALLDTPLEKAYEVMDRCDDLGISVISLDDPEYPKRLMDISDPPAVLYVRGDISVSENRLSIGVVGARSATSYGKKTAHVISGSLAKSGVVIVSGGALGIDSISHTAALEAGGLTVCVLGCGINYPYLTDNRKLRDNIALTGAVISEYPPDHPPARFTFPDRNRLISGLSDGVLVIEAGEKSGSLITARLAAEQGRDVFAVMGNITSPYSQGTNALIKNGAIPVTDHTDITSHYPNFGIDGEPDDIIERIPVHKTDINVSGDAAAVYRSITAEPIHIDKIASASGLSVRKVLRAITELELEGLIAADLGRMYHII